MEAHSAMEQARVLFEQFVKLQRAGHEEGVEALLVDCSHDVRAEFERMRSDYDALMARGLGISQAHFEAGAIFGEFQLVREVGRGGVAVVWEAQQLTTDKTVALKLLSRSFSFSPRVLQRFSREAIAGGRLAHAHIAHTHAIGEQDGVHFIVQEYVPGGKTLADWINDCRLERRLTDKHYLDLARTFAKIARALQFAHESGIVHRDIKPQNVLLTAEGEPKIADFGLASVEDEHSLSGAGEFLGTPYYVSPEQAMGGVMRLDARTDVFSLGATLYEALTLVRAFEGDSRDQILEQLVFQDPVDPRKLRSQIPRELAVISLKALEKDRRHRFASMADMAEDLERFIRHEPIKSHPPGLWLRAKKWARRNPVSAWSFFAAALLSAGVIVAWSAQARARISRSNMAEERARILQHAELRALRDDAELLWPLHPDVIPELEAWLERAYALIDTRAAAQERLQSLRANALSTSTRESDRPLPWRFASTDDQWRHDKLELYLSELDDFIDPEHGWLDGVAEPFGWGIRKRLEFLQGIRWRSLESTAARSAWNWALAEIARNSDYSRTELEPQLGLLPLGPDPVSGLHEFAHLASGDPPERDPDSERLEITEASSIVLILIPSESFWMGAQKQDRNLPNWDHRAYDWEGPIHPVALPAYFISKYETTQAQWERMTGAKPSYHVPGSHSGISKLNPVEQVDWHEANTWLSRFDLRLPAESHWEHSARGRTQTYFWTGANHNIQSIVSTVGEIHQMTVSVNSGFQNPFGLYKVAGNVREWCVDDFGDYRVPVNAAGDRVDSISPGGERVARGSSFLYGASESRSAARWPFIPSFADRSIGVRAARLIHTVGAD